MKLLYLTNIPAPYRVKRFNDMVEIFNKQEIEFEVMFMAKNEPDRDWDVNANDMHFPYRIWSGIHPVIKKYCFHFNPSLLFRLLKHDYDIIIIAGIATPTLMLAPHFVGKKAIKIISVETNLRGDTKKTGVTKWMKSRLLGKADGYQVTGTLQKEYITYFSPSAEKKKFIILPNLINGKLFFEKSRLGTEEKVTLRNKYGIPLDSLVCIIPARLVDIKYPEAFLAALPQIKQIHFVLVGSGPMENVIKEVAKTSSVTMIPFKQQEEMASLYGMADVFCLSSITDASPLTTIEACCCSLPLLISNRIGNIYDVLEEGKNGYSFSPYSTEEIIKAFDSFTRLTQEERTKMSRCSREMYLKTFDNEKCLTHYAEQIVNVVNSNN